MLYPLPGLFIYELMNLMKSTKVQTLGTICLKGEQTGMKLSCIKPRQKSEVYISIESGSSTGYIDASGPAAGSWLGGFFTQQGGTQLLCSMHYSAL